VRNAALTGGAYRQPMDTVAKSGHPRAGAGEGATNLHSRDAHGAGHAEEHGCAVPGYLQLPDLGMFWQCADCGETWAVAADRRSPGSPLEFVWVKDPIQPAGWRTA
jgi:hypothetical protein